MADKNVFVDNLMVLTSPEGIQKYVMGTKKNGTPRAVYDIVKDVFDIDTKKKKKKKHKKNAKKRSLSAYDFYISKKKKHKKHKKHWHI